MNKNHPILNVDVNEGDLLFKIFRFGHSISICLIRVQHQTSAKYNFLADIVLIKCVEIDSIAANLLLTDRVFLGLKSKNFKIDESIPSEFLALNQIVKIYISDHCKIVPVTHQQLMEMQSVDEVVTLCDSLMAMFGYETHTDILERIKNES